MVKADFNLKIKDNIMFYSLYVEGKKFNCYWKQGFLNDKKVFEIEEVEKKIIFLELNDKGFYNKISYQ